jgi:BASS family bile acid:Na+ symporter
LEDFYARAEHSLAALQLAFAMLGMGALLAPRDFVTVFRLPRALFVGLGLQWLIVPMLAASLPLLLAVSPPVTVGLVLVAAVPGGTMSNVYTYFAKGNIALSISLTAVTTVASLAMTPMLLRLLSGDQLPSGFTMPTARIATEIGVVLLLPLALGMLIGSRLDLRRERFSKWAIRISVFFILVLIVGATGSDRLDPSRYSETDQLAALLLAVAFFCAAALVVRLARLPGEDRTAITIEATLRNINLGVLVKASLFPASEAHPIGDAMLFTIALFGGAQMLIAAIPILTRRLGFSI